MIDSEIKSIAAKLAARDAEVDGLFELTAAHWSMLLEYLAKQPEFVGLDPAQLALASWTYVQAWNAHVLKNPK